MLTGSISCVYTKFPDLPKIPPQECKQISVPKQVPKDMYIRLEKGNVEADPPGEQFLKDYLILRRDIHDNFNK